MRGYIVALASLLSMLAVPLAVGSCGNVGHIIIEDCPKGPDGGWDCDAGDGSDAGDAGDASDGGQGGGMSFCPGQCIPLPPDDWQGPRLLWVGPEDQAPSVQCPPQAPVLAWTGHDGLNADSPQCDSCGCDPPSGTCSPPETFTAHNAICQDLTQGVLDTPFAPPAMWDGMCTSENAIDAGKECPENSGVACVQSVTVGKLVLTESKCQPTFQPPKILTAPTWDLLGIACKGTLDVAACNDPGKVCVPTADPPPPGYAQCVFHDGDIQSCPAEFPFRTVLYAAYDDSRQCTPCGCGDPEGSVCMGLATVYRDLACADPIAFLTVTSDKAPCGDILPAGAALGSKTVTGLAYTAGVCLATGGEPMGEAIPIEPRTFCCMA